MGIIYIMLNLPFFWKVKIGVTTWKHLKARRKSVSKSTWGFVFPIWIMLLPFGVRRLEQDLHRFCKPFHAPFEKGSGRTEWFFILAAPIAWVIINVTALVYWSPMVFGTWILCKHILA